MHPYPRWYTVKDSNYEYCSCFYYGIKCTSLDPKDYEKEIDIKTTM